MSTCYVILSVIIRMMRVLLCIWMIDIIHVILLLMHLLILSKVLLLLIHRLGDNSLGVKVHSQVLEPFDFKLENFGTVKIFIVYSEFLLNFKLCQLRAS